jgi:hypothetical protein
MPYAPIWRKRERERDNELSSVNWLHERKLCSRLRASYQFVFQCIVCICEY